MIKNRPEAINILVIEDHANTRKTIQDVLTTGGYRVLTAANGREGLCEFQKGGFDLLIVDIFMPEQDGFEVLMELKRTSPETKALVISGGGSFGLREALRWIERFGAVSTLAKPFTAEQLLASVAGALRGPVTLD